MNPTIRHSYFKFKYFKLPSVSKVALYCRDDLDEDYDPITFFLTHSNDLISVEFEVAALDRVVKYYFEDKKWVSLDWESESQAMKSPNWKDYPIRLMRNEAREIPPEEALEVVLHALSRNHVFPDIFSNLKSVLFDGKNTDMAFAAVEASVVDLVRK